MPAPAPALEVSRPTAAEWNALYAQASEATAAGSKSFFFATRFFPRALARQAYAVYWFCRTTDDLVDEAPTRAQGEAQLNQWEAELRAGWQGVAVQSPILRLFLEVCRQCEIPEEYPFGLIAGCRMDLEQHRFASFGELKTFCYRVASTVGLMMCHVIGFVPGADPERARQHAIDLGIAMQLTNILRDVGTDLDLGRIYFPADELARFELTVADLEAAHRGEPFPAASFRRFLEFQMQRARMFYASAEPGIVMLQPRGRFAVEIAARVYERILSEIVRNNFDVFRRRAVVPSREKYWITARSLSSSLLARALPNR